MSGKFDAFKILSKHYFQPRISSQTNYQVDRRTKEGQALLRYIMSVSGIYSHLDRNNQDIISRKE